MIKVRDPEIVIEASCALEYGVEEFLGAAGHRSYFARLGMSALGMNQPSNAHRDMLRDLILFFRKAGDCADADSKNAGATSRFDEGRSAAYREVLNSIKNHAVSFGVSLEELELEGFNPLSDSLALPPELDT